MLPFQNQGYTHDLTACIPLDKDIVSLIHGSHRLWATHVIGTTSVIYFCHKCGHFTEASLRLLSRQCPGHPHPTFLWRLGRIQKGLHPTHKDVRISAPHKVHTGATCPPPASSSTMASRAEGEGGALLLLLQQLAQLCIHQMVIPVVQRNRLTI